MYKINETFLIFNNCTNLPMCALNNGFSLLCSKGYDSTFEDFLNTLSLKRDIMVELPKKSYSHLTYDNIEYLSFPILHESKPLFIVIGPFTSLENNNLYNLKYLNPNSFKYIYNLFFNILDDISSSKRLYTENLLINKALNYIYHTYCMPIKIDDLCKTLNIDKSYFCKLFKKETGYTFTEYVNILRVEKSKELLKNKEMSLFDIAILTGFNNHSYYSKIFKKITEISPLQYRQKFSS